MKNMDIILSLTFVTIFLLGLILTCEQQHDKVAALDMRVSKAERTLIMLHACFPNGHYSATAAPTCPVFKATVMDQLIKGGE